MSTFLLLAGCELLFDSTGSIPIRFSGANTYATRAEYGEIIGEFKRIEWQDGDKINVISDYAETENSGHSHVYTVTPSEARNPQSSSFAKFKLDELNERGLRWKDDGRMYNFWSVYADDESTQDTSSFQNVKLALSGGESKIYVPSGYLPYLMVAHTATTYDNTSPVFLRFYPAFTGFEISIEAENGISISQCQLQTEKDYLVGSFTGIISDQDKSPVREVKMVVSEIEDGSTIANPGKIESNIFNFFCLPWDYQKNDIKVVCTFEFNNKSATKSLTLPFAFASSKYHILNLSIDSSVLEPDDPEDFDLKVRSMGQEVGGNIVWSPSV